MRFPCWSGGLQFAAPSGWPPIVLFALMFLWTPPHFWALAIRYREDYRSVGVPMLPVVVSFKRTASHILAYTVLVVAVSLVFAWVAGMGALYPVSAGVLGAVFLWLASRFGKSRQRPWR